MAGWSAYLPAIDKTKPFRELSNTRKRRLRQQSHPFTIASTANPDHQHHTLSLRVKTRDGITRQLAKRAGRDGNTSVVVEGPYGGLEERLSSFDDVLLVAGGVGGTFVWPIAEQLTRMGKPFRMVWSVRTEGMLDIGTVCSFLDASTWFDGSLVDKENVQLHITDCSKESKIPGSPCEQDGPSKSSDPEKSLNRYPVRHYGRPDVPRLVREFGRDAATRSRIAVIGELLVIGSLLMFSACGPASLIAEVGVGCREVQWSIASGKYDLAEMWLHREAFSW